MKHDIKLQKVRPLSDLIKTFADCPSFPPNTLLCSLTPRNAPFPRPLHLLFYFLDAPRRTQAYGSAVLKPHLYSLWTSKERREGT
jgi:hypothetical protein